MSLNKISAAVAILILLLVGMWWLSLFEYSMKWDIMDITLPWNYYISECIRNFELPLWNPFLKNGFPQMGLNDTWYPITWLISLTAGMSVWTIQLDYLLHLFIAGFGMFLFMRLKEVDDLSCFSISICYMFSGVMIGNAQHLGWVIGAAWLPWVLYYFDNLLKSKKRKDIAMLALVCSLMFYGSYPPITIIVAYILLGKLVVSLIKKEIEKGQVVKSFGISFFLFLLLSAVGLVGMLDLSPHLNRGAGLPLSNEGWGVLTGHFPYQALSSLLIPYAGSSVAGYWGSDIALINCYFGFIPCLLIITGLIKRSSSVRNYFMLGLLFFMIAMSEVFPFRAWLYHLPLFDRFRFPALFKLFGIFFLLCSCGYAIKAIQKSEELKINFRKTCLFALGLLSILIIFLSFKSDFKQLSILLQDGIFAFNRAGGFWEKAMLNVSIPWIVLACLIAVLHYKTESFRFLYLFVILEVLIISQFNISETVVHNGDPSIGNNEINAFDGRPVQADLISPMNTYNDGAWKKELTWFRFNQASITKTYSAGGSSPFSLKTYQEAKRNGDLSINRYPLLFFAGIKNDEVDKDLVVSDSHKFISVLSASANEIKFQTNYAEDTNLIFLQNYYPGWIATVDNKETKINSVNTSFMSIGLQGGQQDITFSFRPKKIVAAFYISLTSFLLVIGGLLLSKISGQAKLTS